MSIPNIVGVHHSRLKSVVPLWHEVGQVNVRIGITSAV